MSCVFEVIFIFSGKVLIKSFIIFFIFDKLVGWLEIVILKSILELLL